MSYNLVELYNGFYKSRCEKYNIPFASCDTYASKLEDDMSRVDKYMFDGLFKDYPDLLTAKRDDIYNKLKQDNELYAMIDDIFALCWG